MPTKVRFHAVVRASLATLLFLSLSGVASADDRDFFRGSGGGAYVMMLLDVSGSMAWTTTEGTARASGDGPDSKLYLAKSALYEVIQSASPAMRMGFAHFRQANHEYRQKRWLYKRAETEANSEDPLTDSDLPWFSAIPFPPAGMPIDFGDELILSGSPQTSPVFDTDFIFPRRTTSNISWNQKKDLACQNPDQATAGTGFTTNDWRLWRMAVYPKLGPEGSSETVMYTRRGTNTYEITLLPLLDGEKPHAPSVFTRQDGTEELRINVRFRVRQVTWAGGTAALDDEREEDMVLASVQADPAAPPPAVSAPALSPVVTPVPVQVGMNVGQSSPPRGGGGGGGLLVPIAVPVGANLGPVPPLQPLVLVAQATSTRTPSRTMTPTITQTPSRTPTTNLTPSRTPTGGATATRTPTPGGTATRTNTPGPSSTRTPTSAGTATRTSTITRTPTRTRTPTPVTSGTNTRTPTSPPGSPTVTRTRTPTGTPTISRTPTQTRTPTITRTPSATPPPSNDCATVAGPWEFTIPMVPFYEQDNSVPPIPFSGVSDYIGYHERTNPPEMFGIGRTWDYLTDETCRDPDAGTYGGGYTGNAALWEPNANATTDGVGAYETFADPLARGCANGCLDRGDVVPWDWRSPPGVPGWQQTNRDEIRFRLAPNLSVGETIPDFRVARYLQDTKTGGTAGRLALKDEYNPALRAPGDPARYPPIEARSLTPLGGILNNFSQWYDDWEVIATDPVKGDPSWECYQRYAILLTDGQETCGGDAGNDARELRLKGVRTFAVGFGSGVTTGDLEEIADQGGTGSIDTDGDGQADCLQFNTCTLPITAGDGVIIADNRDELVNALKGVFSVVNLDTSTFATGAVPTAENSTSDSIALTSFLPLQDASVWPGTVNHFVQPIPFIVDANGLFRPDASITCSQARTTGCLAWEAGAQLLLQAPSADDALTDRQIGELPLERRVTYSQAAGTGVPRSVRSFDYPVTADEHDLWNGFGIAFTPGDTTSEASARTTAEATIRRTLEVKTAVDPRVDDGSVSLDYVLGDSLHGEPVFLSAPEQFFYLSNDLEGNGRACDDTVNPNRGYRCFFEKNQLRRQVLLLNSNDGQIHAFDGGTFDARIVRQQLQGEFDPGTGHELWSHITRPMLKHVRTIADDTGQHQIGVDGAMWADDFFIDPVHGGSPDPAEREWRTVVLGGYREGDSGYFAIDVTQPDPLEKLRVKNFAGVFVDRYVPQTGSNYVPTCTTNYSSTQCGPLPYPSVLWEFTDACDGTTACVAGQKDEDANGHQDLGFTWSKPNTGRVRVRVGTTVETRFVAIFGGGIRPEIPDSSGNYLYMIDVETGSVLYKRVLVGSAPSEPAAVDSDQNGFLDTIYIGTTAGAMYKVDVSTPATVTSGVLSTTTEWAPLRIFNTEARPIFYPPTVLFVSQLGKYALAFGTGNREDLWASEIPPEEGRFYTVLDSGFDSTTTGLPLTEANLQPIAKTDGSQSMNLLVSPTAGFHAGWVMLLEADERVVTEAFALEGLLTFNAFSPNDEASAGQSCDISAGNANIYTLLSTNGNPLSSTGDRTRTVSGLASSPYVMPASVSESGFQGSQQDPFTSDEIQGIRDTLKDLYPANCSFGNFALRVAANVSNTAQFAVAEVPVCVVVKNWKEF